MQYRILLVEDSPTDAELFQEMLLEHQFDVWSVERLADAYDCLQQSSFDLILLDLELPDSKGLQTFNKLHAVVPQTAIVVLTGLDDEEVAQQAVGLGAQDYLYKGSVVESLLAQAIRYAIERNRLQTQLQESEMRYRELFNNAQDIIYTQGMDGRITSVNREFVRLLGFSKDEIIGKSPHDIAASLVAEDNVEPLPWADRLAKLQSNGKTISEFVVRNKQGELIPLEVTNRLIYRNGEAVGVQGIARDISERKEALAALAKSERDFRLLAENSSDMISRHDPTGVYLYASPACMRLLGYRPDELAGRSAYEFIHPDDIESINDSFKSIATFPATYTVEYRIRKKDGAYTWFESTNHPVGDPETKEIMEVQAASRDISERKEAEAEIRAAQQFAQNTVDALSAHIAIIDENGLIIATNRTWDEFARNNGANPELTGRGINYLDVLENVADSSAEAHDAQAFAKGLREVLEEKSQLYSQEYPCHSPTKKRWFLGRITRFKEGNSVRAVIAHENISRLKLAEENLSILNQNLKQKNRNLQYLHNIGSALASTLEVREIGWKIFNGVGRILLDSPHFVLASYDSESQLISCQFAIVDGVEQSPENFPVMPLGKGPTSDAIRTRDIQIVDIEVTHQQLAGTGRIRQIGDSQLPKSALYIPITSGNKVTGVMSFQNYHADAYKHIDHTLLTTIATQVSVAVENSLLYTAIQDHAQYLEDRVAKRTADLDRMNKRISAILNNASDAILLVADDGTIEITNPAFNRIFGYEVDELFARPLQFIVDSNDQETLMQTMQQVWKTSIPQRTQVKCRCKDYSTFDAEIAIASVPNNESHLVCTVFDITQFKVVERMKDQFISMVNHELRTPVAGMVLSSSTLQNYYDRLSDEQRLRKIGQIQQQANLMSELINAILDISRIEARGADEQQDEVDMVHVLDAIVTELLPSAQDKQQRLENITAVEQAVFQGNQTDFARIWRNLIGNAIKYTPEHGKITIQTTVTSPGCMDLLPDHLPDGDYIIGTVCDNGPGISPEDQKQLFTRFFRGWAKKSQIPGTGLGLALVRELLHLYDGDINVASTINEGTTFTFWIPVNQ